MSALTNVRPNESAKLFLLEDSIRSLEVRLSNLEVMVQQQETLIKTCGFPAACQILLSTGKISPAQLLPRTRDLLSSAIIESLLVHRRLAISELAARLKVEAGKGDRKTVRKRLQKLSTLGIVLKFEASDEWGLTPHFMEKWLSFISSLTTPMVPSHLDQRGC